MIDDRAVPEGDAMPLQTFIEANYAQLLVLTREKVAKRNGGHRAVDLEQKHGVPLFLHQLGEALEQEARQDPAQRAHADPPTNPNIADSAALHGLDLLDIGFSIDQVVHDYGDVCQAVTEMAVEMDAPISVAEFHTLNRCLDNAIAAAVNAWSQRRETDLLATGGTLRDAVFGRLRVLLNGAIVVFDLLRDGQIGSSGSAAALMGRQLTEMRAILDTASPEVPQDAGAPPARGADGNG
jgi:hypothetical protein